MKYILLGIFLFLSCKNYELKEGRKALHRSRQWNYNDSPYMSKDVHEIVKIISIKEGRVKYIIRNEIKNDTISSFLPIR